MSPIPSIDGTHPLLSERLALSRAEVARLLGVSKSLAYRLTRQGGLATVPAGRRRIVPVTSLIEWLRTGSALDRPA